MSGREENYDAKADIVDRLEELLNNTPENLDEKVKELQVSGKSQAEYQMRRKTNYLDSHKGIRALGADYASHRQPQKQQGGGTQRRGEC